MVRLPVYLDNNATTPCDPRVVEAMLPYFAHYFGNAASHNHAYGWEAAGAVDLARSQLAKLLGAEPNEIIFTSGATEADNLALKGVFELYAARGNHIITANTEHRAVLDTCRHIERLGGEITYLNAGADGRISLSELEGAIRPTTVLVAIMYANNETGVIQPVGEISAIARKKGALFFCDATQALGKIPLDVNRDGIDLLACSAHKIYGPKGIGALYVRRKKPRVRLAAQMDGGGHERGMRSGTLNVPAIVGMGAAATICLTEMEADAARIATLRDRLEKSMLKLGSTCINGNNRYRLPQVTNLSFGGLDGRLLLSAVNKHVAVSSGSACTSALPEPSHVLKAMGLNDERAHASLRFSLGRFTTNEEVDYAIARVSEAVINLRNRI